MPENDHVQPRRTLPEDGGFSPNPRSPFVELGLATCFSFLRGASEAVDLARSAWELGYDALGCADFNTLAGVVRLHVDANSPIADKSAYTAIVARMLTLYGGPHLVLNSNYEQTDVPVPKGIRGAAQPASIVR